MGLCSSCLKSLGLLQSLRQLPKIKYASISRAKHVKNHIKWDKDCKRRHVSSGQVLLSKELYEHKHTLSIF